MTSEMGITYAESELIRSDDLALVRAGYLPVEQVNRVVVTATVDSGATLLTIPVTLSQRLNLAEINHVQVETCNFPLRKNSSSGRGQGLNKLEAELADGSTIETVLVGPIDVRFQNRRAVVNALVMPDGTDILLGAVPMQQMDVLIDPKRERLIVNPESPERARLLLK